MLRKTLNMRSCKAGGQTRSASLVSEWIERRDELLISKYVREEFVGGLAEAVREVEIIDSRG